MMQAGHCTARSLPQGSLNCILLSYSVLLTWQQLRAEHTHTHTLLCSADSLAIAGTTTGIVSHRYHHQFHHWHQLHHPPCIQPPTSCILPAYHMPTRPARLPLGDQMWRDMSLTHSLYGPRDVLLCNSMRTRACRMAQHEGTHCAVARCALCCSIRHTVHLQRPAAHLPDRPHMLHALQHSTPTLAAADTDAAWNHFHFRACFGGTA
jgi:hypothetical protein